MKRIEEILGMPMVTVQEGLRLGKLSGVEVDTRDGRLRYLHFDGASNRAAGVVPWEAVRSIGTDAVTVESKALALETIPMAEREFLSPHVGDRPVMTESGKQLGKVSSYTVDESTGLIDRYYVASGGILGIGSHQVRFTHAAVRSFGKDAIIVSDEIAEPPKQ